MPVWLDNGDERGESLPWVEAYVAEHGASGTPLMVLRADVKIKGIMIATAEWKAFVFKGSTAHDNLKEALEVYIASEVKVHKLIAVATDNGKVKLGLETETKANCSWKFMDGAYHQTDDNPKKKGVVKKQPKANPLMPSLAEEPENPLTPNN